MYGFHWGFHVMINKRVCQNFHQWENCSVKTRLDSQTFFTLGLEQLIASSGLLTRNARWLIGVWSRSWQQNACHCKVVKHYGLKIRQSTIYYSVLLGRWDKRIDNQESDVPSIIFFILFRDLGHSKLFIFIFVFFKKN